MKIIKKLKEVRDKAFAVVFVAGVIVLVIPALATLVISSGKPKEEKKK